MRYRNRAHTSLALIPIPVGAVLGLFVSSHDLMFTVLIVGFSVFASAFVLHRAKTGAAEKSFSGRAMATSFIAVGALVGWVALRESVSLAALVWAMMGYASWFMWIYVSSPTLRVAGLGFIIPGTFMVAAFGFFLAERLPTALWVVLALTVIGQAFVIWEGLRMALRKRTPNLSDEIP